MKIVQILPELNQGGVERGVVEISREFVRRGHRSIVISAGGVQADQIEKDGGEHIELDVCSKNPLTFFVRVSRLRNVLQQLEPDILHVRSRVPAWLAWFANKKLKTPFVTTVHGFNSVSKYSEIMTKGDRVLYVSSAIKSYILQHYSVDEKKMRYVPRGIDIAYFDPKKIDTAFVSAFKKEHALEGKRIVSTIGRITELKGIDDFIRALSMLQKKNPDVVGLVVGGARHDKEEYFESLKILAKKEQVDVRFVGSQSSVREIYAVSDLMVSATSLKPEAFGRTIGEALAMNTPVIATHHGGALDIIVENENGFFFPPKDSKGLAEKMEQALSYSFKNMREHIEKNFSLERMTQTELSIYEELLDHFTC